MWLVFGLVMFRVGHLGIRGHLHHGCLSDAGSCPDSQAYVLCNAAMPMLGVLGMSRKGAGVEALQNLQWGCRMHPQAASEHGGGQITWLNAWHLVVQLRHGGLAW